ncbi:hypothetical protein COY62_01930 [bacterium (Candidatus Howlettbacteria) CG_4_10_14_0_8_um_filter_40_9]|nr:MAG: hypothetical protein COY62_01930 [bacterium (Candidatus Howlettbacteria) CG_4_10_14_0_8_um_filter_40_9]
MKTAIKLYSRIRKMVSFFVKRLKLDRFRKVKGRKLALSLEGIVSLGLFKQRNNIATKKALYEIFEPKCSYKTMVVTMNRFCVLGLLILINLLKNNRDNQHIIKHIDSTDIPVCLFKNANAHKTMRGLSSFGRNSKGTFFGLKMHIISDLKRQILAIKFTPANTDDRAVVIGLAKDMEGIFVADAGYISEKLGKQFYRRFKRILVAKPRANMKKIMTKFEENLYRTRMLIEINFRNLKMFYGLVTSLPRSIDGYLANYIYSLLAYQIA